MAMNIKSEEAHHMAQELAGLTGETLTAAVATAIRERLHRVRGTSETTSLADRLLAIGREVGEGIDKPFRSVDHGELLYDEMGLPK